MSKAGRLKASTNRVRTSDSLQGNSMWNKTIGVMDAQLGTNTAVEAYINAPQAGGGGRAARRAAAQEIVAQTGGFDSAVNSFESLLSLARSQGALGGQNRGACKRCGQLGHLTKQCRNPLAAAEDGRAGPAGTLVAGPVLPPMPEGSESSDLSLSSSSGSSGSSSSESSGAARRRKREKKERERKRGKKERKEKRRRKEERKRRRDKKETRRQEQSNKRRRSRSSSGD